MQIKFIGTGAADWDWSRPLDELRRGSCCTLLDNVVLIDAGKTALESLNRSQVELSSIQAIVLTHSHSDHFNLEAVKTIAAAPRSQKLQFFAAAETVELLDDCVEKHILHQGSKFSIGNLNFTALPSNHMVENPYEETFNYLIETAAGKRLFYNLDSAWITTRARHLLRGTPLDMIIWDATTGTTFCDWRFAEHNDLEMIRIMRRSMLKAEMITPDTVHIFDHIARTLWPAEQSDQLAAARQYQGIMAQDGMTLEL